MPELPEVETIRRQLSEKLVGEVVAEIEIREMKSFLGDPQQIIGTKIKELTRQGKYLFFHLESERGIVGHLKMTGRLVIANGQVTMINGLNYELAKHTRVVIILRSGVKLYFWDTRKFGYMKVLEDSYGAEVILKTKMGPDPWQMDEDRWIGVCKRSKRNVKSLLLDQIVISGIGNIYANDALWKAGIYPMRTANSLKRPESMRLLRSIREVMERGLATGGASDNSYVDALGKKGTYQDEFLVYRRTGQPCRRDGNPIKRIVIGGRGTWYCAKCQK